MKENLPKPVQYGNYLLLDRINVGGMAEVFRAKSSSIAGIERLVAIKRILPHLARDPDFSNMFIDEARIAINLRHANIAQMYELSRVGDSLYIAMEYVHGRDLRALINRMRYLRRDLPLSLVVHVISKVCEGLDYAHSKRDDLTMQPMNIVHRDVSPQNVIVSYEGEVKIIDFGIAKAASKRSHTEAGILKGKFGYMAPEQVSGSEIDQRADVFCTGILMYELLTTDRLFAGSSELSTLRRIRNVEVTPPSILNRAVPDELEEIVLKALAARPEDRYTYASELADDLQRFLVASKAEVFSSRNLRDFMLEIFGADFEEDQQKLETQLRYIPDQQPEEKQAPSADNWAKRNEEGQAWRQDKHPDNGQYPDTPSSISGHRDLAREYSTQEELPASRPTSNTPAGYQSADSMDHAPSHTRSLAAGTPPHPTARPPEGQTHQPEADEGEVPPTILVPAHSMHSSMQPHLQAAGHTNAPTPAHPSGMPQYPGTGASYHLPHPPQPASPSKAWIWILLWLLLGGLFLGMVYLLFFVPVPQHQRTPTHHTFGTPTGTPTGTQPGAQTPGSRTTPDQPGTRPGTQTPVPPIPRQQQPQGVRTPPRQGNTGKSSPGPQKRWVMVHSKPKRALLYVDGKLMGKTPARFRLWPRTSPYVLRLRKAGYSTSTSRITLTTGSGARIIHMRLGRTRSTQRTVTPRPEPKRPTPRRQPGKVTQHGYLTIKGSPIARIYINGIDTGRYLLYRHRLPAGRYKVHFVTREGDVWNTQIAIKAGKETNRVSTFKK